MENIYKIIIGASASIVTYFFGGWNDSLALLALLCVLDYLSGIAAAAYEGYKFLNDPTKGINSNKGFWGIFKKFLMFSVIAVLYRVDMLFVGAYRWFRIHGWRYVLLYWQRVV
jgi:phage-related holin